MSEPHELEERVMRVMFAAPKSEDGSHNFKHMARAVLNLVRQEQENARPRSLALWIGEWWLSHTAPQEK